MNGYSQTVGTIQSAAGGTANVVKLNGANLSIGNGTSGISGATFYGTIIDNGAVILAPGGKSALLLAVDAESGNVLWQTPNPRGWKMTHSSLVPMEFEGERMYVYCANGGVVGVVAATQPLS